MGAIVRVVHHPPQGGGGYHGYLQMALLYLMALLFAVQKSPADTQRYARVPFDQRLLLLAHKPTLPTPLFDRRELIEYTNVVYPLPPCRRFDAGPAEIGLAISIVTGATVSR